MPIPDTSRDTERATDVVGERRRPARFVDRANRFAGNVIDRFRQARPNRPRR
jgi:hypothetical protein